ncbi:MULTISPECIES: MerR family transcriptional regulator [Olivibacter]|uniref:Helix-turn-helix domain-containing protein n=1 Tax=Olivibacter jilunii TaxID=985016 RepID=A0ABW6ASE3_9SPHI|nr:hypothetical protein [Olivibacter sp. 47]MDM8176415.1 hypothetical protein [Olivibacter sp. 47]
MKHYLKSIKDLLEVILSIIKTYIEEKHKALSEASEEEHLFNRKQAADYLLVHPKTITNWRNRKLLSAVTKDRKVPLYRQSDLDRCFERYWGRRKDR